MSKLQVDRIVNATDTGGPFLPSGVVTGFQIISITSSVITLTGGIRTLADYTEYATYNGTTTEVDLTINLKTEVNTLGVTSPTPSQTYWLYLKINSTGGPVLTALGRSVKTCQKGTSGAFIVLSTAPQNVDQTTYVPLALVKADGTGNYTQYQNIDYGMPGAVIPATRFSGYTKFVSSTGFASLTAAAPVSGDNILVAQSYTVTGGETISASNVHITFLPGVIITSTGTPTPLTITGSQVHVIRPRYAITATGVTVPSGIALSGNNNEVVGALINLNGAGTTLTDAYRINAGALRNFINGAVFSSAGTITNTLTDLGTDTDASIRG